MSHQTSWIEQLTKFFLLYASVIAASYGVTNLSKSRFGALPLLQVSQSLGISECGNGSDKSAKQGWLVVETFSRFIELVFLQMRFML